MLVFLLKKMIALKCFFNLGPIPHTNWKNGAICQMTGGGIKMMNGIQLYKDAFIYGKKTGIVIGKTDKRGKRHAGS